MHLRTSRTGNDRGLGRLLGGLASGPLDRLGLERLDGPRAVYWKTWKRYVDDHLLRPGLISPDDMNLFKVMTHYKASPKFRESSTVEDAMQFNESLLNVMTQ